MATPVDQIVIVTPPETTPASSVGAGTRVFTIENDVWVHFDLGDAVGVFAPRAITIGNPIGGISPIPATWANTFVTDSTGTTYFVDASLAVHDITQRRIVVNPLHFDGDGSSGAPLEIADGAISGDLVAAEGIGWGKLPTTTGASIVGRLEGTNGAVAPLPIDMVDSFVDDGGTLKTKLTDAPADGEQYSRQNGGWVPDRWLKTELDAGAVTINSQNSLGITTNGNSHWRTSGVLTIGGQTGTNAVFDVAALKTTINGVNGVDLVTNGVVAIQSTNVQLGAIGAAVRQPAVPPSDWGAGKFPTWSDANTVTWADVPPQIPTPTVPADADKYVSVDAGGNYVLTNPPTAPSLAFTDLTDTPTDYLTHQNKLVAVNALGDALVFIDAPTGGGAQTFLQLTDTPTSYGTAGQMAVVNSAADGLEFITAPADRWLGTELPAGDVIVNANNNAFEINNVGLQFRGDGWRINTGANSFSALITGGSDLLLTDTLARINAPNGATVLGGQTIDMATTTWQKTTADNLSVEYTMPDGVVPSAGQLVGATSNGVLGFVDPNTVGVEKWLKTELEAGNDVLIDAQTQTLQIIVGTVVIQSETLGTPNGQIIVYPLGELYLHGRNVAEIDSPIIRLKSNGRISVLSDANATLYRLPNVAPETDRVVAMVADGSTDLNFREIMVGGGNSNADPNTLWDTLSVNSMRPMGGTGNPADHGGLVTFGGKYISGELQVHWADGGKLNYRTRGWDGTLRGWWQIYTEQSGVPWSSVTGAPTGAAIWEQSSTTVRPVSSTGVDRIAIMAGTNSPNFQRLTSNTIRVNASNDGTTLDLGGMDSAYARIGTSAGQFYFNRGIQANGNIRVYNNQSYIGATALQIGSTTTAGLYTNNSGVLNYQGNPIMHRANYKMYPDNFRVGADAYWDYRFYNGAQISMKTNNGGYEYIQDDLQMTADANNIDLRVYAGPTHGTIGPYGIWATDTGGTGRYEIVITWEYGLEMTSTDTSVLNGLPIGFYDGAWWHVSFLSPTGSYENYNRVVSRYVGGWTTSTKNSTTPWGLRVLPSWGFVKNSGCIFKIRRCNVYIRQVY